MKIPALVAHRGYTRRHPENTREAVIAAVAAGACYVEFDVQLTADRVPVLFHDTDLERTTGMHGCILEMTLDQVRALDAGELRRLGQRAGRTQVPTLGEIVTQLDLYPRLKAFVEIKQESIGRFGLDVVMDSVMAQLAGRLDQCYLISFAREVLSAARQRGARLGGWVMDRWNESALQWIAENQPDVVFCNYKKIPGDVSLDDTGCDWVLYEITDPELALHWAGRGATMIETFDIGGMLADPRLAQRSCLYD